MRPPLLYFAVSWFFNVVYYLAWDVVLGDLYAGIVEGTEQLISGAGIPHPSYPTSLWGPADKADIGLIRLASPAVLFPLLVQIVRLPSSGYVPPDGSVATAVGWGDNGPSA